MYEGNEIPLGLSMAMAQNRDAFEYFSSLTMAHQEELINQVHDIQSKDEMQQFVNSWVPKARTDRGRPQ